MMIGREYIFTTSLSPHLGAVAAPALDGLDQLLVDDVHDVPLVHINQSHHPRLLRQYHHRLYFLEVNTSL